MGVAFVLVSYVPGFFVALFGLMSLGMSFEAARRTAGSPVLSGLVVGALYLCGSEGWLLGVPAEVEHSPEEEDFSSHRAKDRRVNALDEKQDRRWAFWRRANWDNLPLTWERMVTGLGATVLLIGLVVALQGRRVATTDDSGTLIDTREVPVEIPELPATATLRVPAAFTPASSALEKAKQRLILNTGKSRSEYSRILSRDWDKEFREIATLSIGQLSSLKDHQGKFGPQQWEELLEKVRTPSQKFQRRVDSLQSRIEQEKRLPVEMTSPTTTVRGGNIIVYKTVQVDLNGESMRQLTARKIMYDSGYSVLADIALTVGSDAPVDSLQEYVGAISFSAK